MLRINRTRLSSSVALGIAAVSVLGLSACATEESASGPVELTVWSRSDGELYLTALAEEYNKTHEDIQVKPVIIPNHDYQSKLGNAIGSGDAPDVAALDDVLAPYFASKGAFVDITDRVGELPYSDDLNEAQQSQGVVDGKTYTVPFTSDNSVMFYNKNLFAQAGLDPEKAPETWQEFADAANAIGKLGPDYTGYHFSAGCGGCTVFTFAPLVWAAGGDILASGENESNPPATFDDPIVAEAVELLNGMYLNGGLTTQSQVDDGSNYGGSFESGQLGIVFSGSFYLTQLGTTPPDFDFGVAPIPGKTAGDIASFAGGDVLGIPEGSGHVDEAWEFLTWATGDEAQTALAEQGITPVRTDLLESVYSSKGPQFAALSEAAMNGKVPYSIQELALFNDANGPLVGLMQNGVFGDDVPAAIDAAQKTADGIVANAG
ncbi:ABC transporter substrate-binding protein [Glaciibacter superstes]|uniref:ABC transporter substrate-binding protein n=1 Tax=Glaciibacter superstes TaxID=501023 RepID=UPI0003B53F6C|nr:ABC transporter substrate-binding protein [Glaciibacter superstes]